MSSSTQSFNEEKQALFEQHREHSIEIAHKPEPAKIEEPARDPTTVAIIITVYWVVSMALVFTNKDVMAEYFPFPLFITLVQLVDALILAVVLGKLGRHYNALSFVPEFEFDFEIAQKVLPLSVIYVTMITLTNVCLSYVEVSFYQLVKSLSIVFNIIVQFWMLGITSSPRVIASCAMITFAFVIGSAGEVNFSWSGLIAGVMSSLVQAFHGVYIKKALAHTRNDTFVLLGYNTTLALLLLFPITLISGEIGGLMKHTKAWSFDAWWALTVTGVLGFLINIAIFLQIKFTSPLTATVSATAKAAAQTIVAVIIYRNPISVLNFYGLTISLLGSSVYAYFKWDETNRK